MTFALSSGFAQIGAGPLLDAIRDVLGSDPGPDTFRDSSREELAILAHLARHGGVEAAPFDVAAAQARPAATEAEFARLARWCRQEPRAIPAIARATDPRTLIRGLLPVDAGVALTIAMILRDPGPVVDEIVRGTAQMRRSALRSLDVLGLTHPGDRPSPLPPALTDALLARCLADPDAETFARAMGFAHAIRAFDAAAPHLDRALADDATRYAAIRLLVLSGRDPARARALAASSDPGVAAVARDALAELDQG